MNRITRESGLNLRGPEQPDVTIIDPVGPLTLPSSPHSTHTRTSQFDEEKGWYLYKMATFPPQHWARVWSPSLRLGGVRLPGLSLRWHPNTYNFALTYISLFT